MNHLFMSDADWAKCSAFSIHEPWGDPYKIRIDLITALEELRAYVGKPILIHCGTQGKHEPNSQHYMGAAVDIHIKGMHVMDQFFAASRFAELTGIGVYPFWANPGLHLDVRDLLPHEPSARWMQNAAGIYMELTAQNIRGIV